MTAVLMNLTSSLYVISGLASLKRQKLISGGVFALHLVMQLFCGMAFLSSIILAAGEWNRYPTERLNFLRNVLSKRQLAAPGFFSASLFLTAFLAGNVISSLIRIGVAEFAFHYGEHNYWPVQRISTNLSFFYIFFFLIIICALIDAFRFSRKLPLGLLERPFLNSLMAYSVVAIVLESMLATILLLFTYSLVDDFTVITARTDKSKLISVYLLFIAINAVAVVAIQASAAYYTRLCIKRAQEDGALLDEDELLFKQNSIYPVAQLVVVYRLKKMCREHEISRNESLQ